MRSNHRLIGLTTLCAAACFVAPTLGQNEKTEEKPAVPAPAPAAPVPAAPVPAAPAPEPLTRWGEFRVTVAQGAPNWKLNLEINGAPVVAMLETVAKVVGRNIIVSDDVRAIRPSLSGYQRLTDLTPDEAVARIVNLATLAWGKAGDTYLVVSRPPVMPLVTAPPPALRLLPSIPQKPEPGRPFDFNGQTFYIVPLKKER